VNVDVSAAKLTEWAESCLRMNHLGTLVQREIDAKNFIRARELAERGRARAWDLLNDLFTHGARKPEGYVEPGVVPEE
jgi:hypothetical protein